MIQEIKDKLKEKNINDTSINKYVRDLILLNNKNDNINDLKFLKNTENIDKYIENDKYKDITKRNYYNSLNVIILLYPKYKKLQEYYYNKFLEYNDKIKANGSMSEEKKNNMINYNELLDILENLKNKVDEFKEKDKLDKKEYNILLQYLILSLYLKISPRRNKDYINMFIPLKKLKLMNDKLNYLFINKSKFIFNNYKTSKIYNEQVIDINNDLMDVIKLYLKYHPLYHNKDNDLIPFLVNYKGLHLKNINSINEVLNKINKNINSTMIRHSYITYQFKDQDEKSKKIAHDMGHSQKMQKEYIV